MMDHSEQVIRISHETGLPADTVDTAIRRFAQVVSAAMLNGDIIKIRNFGTLLVYRTYAHYGINPRTKARIIIKAKQKVLFRPTEKLRT